MVNLNEEFYAKFNKIEKDFDELQGLISSTEVISDNKLYNFYKKKYDKIFKIANLYKTFKQVTKQIEDNKNLLKTENEMEFVNELNAEQRLLKEKSEKTFELLKTSLMEMQISKEQKVKIEITFKSGQSEYLTKYLDIFNDYSKIYNCIINIEKQTESSLVVCVEGENVFDDLSLFIGNSKIFMFEKESVYGISVIEIFDDEFQFNDEDIKFETLKSGGAGGQHINKTESAVRLIHIPTGISVVCQDERSQQKNKVRAIEILKSKVNDYFTKKQQKEVDLQRKNNKNALFSSTPTTIFDFDKNVFYSYKTKQNYKLKDILSGQIKIISRDVIDNDKR